MFHPIRSMLAAVLAMASLAATPARADINVGVTLSLTGPAASLGMPAKRAIDLLPKEVAGQKLNFILLDDTSDPSVSVRNFRRLVDEHKVDVVMGSSVTPSTIALVDIAAETKVPLMSLAASARIVEPQDEKRRWAFKAIQNENLMIGATLDHMQQAGTKTLAFMGFSDAYGDAWLSALQPLADKAGIKLVATERYVRTDTSVVAQTLKIIAAKPDAVLVAASGTPGALPQKTLNERGYKGSVYQTYGIANRDFLRVAGKDAEGAIFAVGPVLVADQLEPGSPVRPVAQDFVKRYEAAYGPNSASIFSANVWDAGLVLRAAIPGALGKGKPGTEAFRIALRDALESTSGVVTTQGVTTMSRTDHVGYDKRAAVLVQIQNGVWKYLK
ncbi:ABC transporter substrate-binding protein [Cupriavidus basilensis]|uniref:Leucine-, isoleucine-, valine-, threonine-, and alanine-binding protein n=1 Tax=Cupriavidus basilensis TaxID=68895 RepID=A0A0C4YJ87_9BURK|nr:ABC transporter substrate-binding protein [Cupriavidus basilensis]AJG21949.1 Leucine-, isoleucine-, valine-, threonine-, and alanine-binding protein [Cupriavidus basilensis]